MLKRIFVSLLLCVVMAGFLFGCVREVGEKIPATEAIIETIIETIVETEVTEEPTEELNEPISQFSEEIEFKYQYVEMEDLKNYGFIIPSSASEENPAALIIWLHGGGEVGCNPGWLEEVGIYRAMERAKELGLQGFNAYIVCPHLYGSWNAGNWTNQRAKQQVADIVNFFVENYPVDTDRVIISGHSLGGLGALYMAVELPEYFDKVVSMSSVTPQGCEIEEIQVPVLGCVETTYLPTHFMNTRFVELFGEENLRKYDEIHAFIPDAALIDDSNENGRSDLIEWIFE